MIFDSPPIDRQGYLIFTRRAYTFRVEHQPKDPEAKPRKAIHPGDDERRAWQQMERYWQSASEERKSPSDNPIPRHLRQTRLYVDFAKWFLLLIAGILAIGWAGNSYVSQFSTRMELQENFQATQSRFSQINDSVAENDVAINSLNVMLVRIMLEQRNISDELHIMRELLTPHESAADRSESQAKVSTLRRRIERREAVQGDAQAFESLAQQMQDQPHRELDGL